MFNKTASTLTMNTDVVKDLMRHLTANQQVIPTSFKFATLKENWERVDFCYELLREYKLLPPLIVDKKNNQQAKDMRQQGNGKFQRKKYLEALEYYTASAAYAENNSEELAFSYANRSAVLFEWKMYEECLTDIKRALENNYPEKLKAKILKRQEKAKELKSSQKRFAYHRPIPKISPQQQNPNVMAAKNCIEIKHDDVLGRMVVATRDIPIGEIIAVEKSYCRIIDENIYIHCQECCRLCYTLIPCPNCTTTLYCSSACLKTAKESYHKYECPILATVDHVKMTRYELMSTKIAFIARHEYQTLTNLSELKLEQNELYRSDRYKEIHNLVGNTEYRNVSDLFNRALTAAILFHLVNKYTKFFDDAPDRTVMQKHYKEIALLHLQTAACNFHELAELAQIHDDALVYTPDRIGSVAYSFLSLFNHACFSNVVRSEYGDVAVVRAICKIKKGEECLDNYGCHQAVMKKDMRQYKLKDQYYFTCQCKPCTEDWPLLDNMATFSHDINISAYHRKLEETIDRDYIQNLLPKLLKDINALEKHIPCQDFNLLQEVLKQCYSVFGNVRKTLH